MPTAEVLSGIQQFQEHYQEREEIYHHLATKGQSPEVLVVACSDSRVPPELLTSVDLGMLFSMRNLGNVVPPFGAGDMGVGAVIEYAVLTLQVRHIVICGHTDCGCIKALDEPPDWSRASHMARWIEHARPAKTKVEASGLPADEHHLATVRENVLLQLGNLRSYDPVREGEKAGALTLHGWVYHLETGIFEEYDTEAGTWVPLGQ